MIPIKPNSELVYDQVYLAYRDVSCIGIAFCIFKYAGIFTEKFSEETVYEGSIYNNINLDLDMLVKNSLIFRLTKDEILTHVVLENLAKNI